MTNIINLKEFSKYLRVHRNHIIQKWLGFDEVRAIFHKHSLPFVDKNTTMFYDFCDCFIGVIEWDSTIADCQMRMEFLHLLNNHNISKSELFTLLFRLKSSIERVLVQDGYFSVRLHEDLEDITLAVLSELSDTYSQVEGEEKSQKSEQANLLSEYKKAVDLGNIVSKTNPKGIITYVNDRFCEISGYTRKELIGKPHNIIRHPRMDREAFKDLWDTIKSKKPWHGIITNLKKNGSQYVVDSTVIPILDVDGDIIEFIAVRHDITELIETKEQLKNINRAMKSKVDELFLMTSTLEQQATRDKLTGLYNRMKFDELYEEAILNSQQDDTPLCLIIFDIDDFKNINDNLGHQVGDTVLVELANLISKNIKISDTFARWGGEEFVILLPNTDVEGAVQFAEKIRKLIKHNHFDQAGKLTASFGVGLLDEYDDKSTLFDRVDKALYKAKSEGKNRIETAQK